MNVNKVCLNTHTKPKQTTTTTTKQKPGKTHLKPVSIPTILAWFVLAWTLLAVIKKTPDNSSCLLQTDCHLSSLQRKTVSEVQFSLRGFKSGRKTPYALHTHVFREWWGAVLGRGGTFVCSSDVRWPFLVFQGRSSSASSFHASLLLQAIDGGVMHVLGVVSACCVSDMERPVSPVVGGKMS